MDDMSKGERQLAQWEADKHDRTGSPFSNDVWVKNAIATGAITPPHTDMRRNDRLTQVYVIGFLILGGLFFWVGMGFR